MILWAAFGFESLADINIIANQRNEMRTTGESYFVGQTESAEHASYRSLRFVKKGNKVYKKKDDQFIQRALAGENGYDIKVGSTGKMELVSYGPVKTEMNVKWALITTIALREFSHPADGVVNKYTKNQGDNWYSYIDSTSYHNLFILSNTGYLFYSVTEGKDFQTNLATGPYNYTGLGYVVKDILHNNDVQFSSSKMRAYEPSNGGDPAFYGSTNSQ